METVMSVDCTTSVMTSLKCMTVVMLRSLINALFLPLQTMIPSSHNTNAQTFVSRV